MFKNALTAKIADFLIEIGLEIAPSNLGETFLPGILIERGKILVDETKLAFPGDLLHEAGHLAVAPKNLRHLLSDEVELAEFNMDAVETAAMLWSYAAALHLELDPRVVFHADGYKGNADALLFNYSLGIYLGLDVLTAARMTTANSEVADAKVQPFPKMLKWLRD